MMHLIWFKTEANTFQADGDHNKKVGSLGKAEWLDLSKGLEDAPSHYFVVNWSAEHFNLRCTLTVPKNTGNTYDTGMQAQVEAEGSERGGRQ